MTSTNVVKKQHSIPTHIKEPVRKIQPVDVTAACLLVASAPPPPHTHTLFFPKHISCRYLHDDINTDNLLLFQMITLFHNSFSEALS